MNRKDNYRCNKKICDMLARLGYVGDTTYPAVSRWIMTQGLYIMPIPRPYWKWSVGIVTLGLPRDNEESLDLVVVEDTVRTVDDAIRIGVDFVVSTLDEEMKMMEETN